MTALIAAALGFVLLHLLVSGTRVRDALTGSIGQGPYMGLFSLASLGLIVWLCVGGVFSTIGGVVGALIFKKDQPPGVIDVPPSA